MTTVEPWSSPLEHIERAVQERAKGMAVDMSGGDATATLRALVDDEIGRWHHEFQRGRRPRDVADPEGAAERAMRNLVGYGPLQALLDDPDVWEIMINAPDGAFF